MDKYLIQKISVFLALFFLFFILVIFGAFSNIQSNISDKLHGGENVLDNIVIIEIDDKSINEIGRWPWDRDVFAQILSKIENADVIGVDLSFFEATEQDSLLNETLQGMDNVVLAAEISEGTLYKPIFDVDHGYVNLISDNDGLIRSVRTDAREDILPFSFQAYAKERDYDPNDFNSCFSRSHSTRSS
jgi:CHASE2 domain-containing sensor protein